MRSGPSCSPSRLVGLYGWPPHEQEHLAALSRVTERKTTSPSSPRKKQDEILRAGLILFPSKWLLESQSLISSLCLLFSIMLKECTRMKKDICCISFARDFLSERHAHPEFRQTNSQPAEALPAGRLVIWNIKSAMFFPSHISSYSAWPLSWYVNKVYHHSIKCRYSALFKPWRWCIIRYVAHWGSPAVYLAIKPQSASSETAVGPGEVHLCMKYSQSNNANLKHQ